MSFFVCLIYDYYMRQRKNKVFQYSEKFRTNVTLINLFQIDVAHTDDDDRARTDQLKCLHYVKLTSLYDTTGLDGFRSRTPPYRKTQEANTPWNKTEDTMESKIHVRADEAAHEEHNRMGSQPISGKDVMTALFGR